MVYQGSPVNRAVSDDLFTLECAGTSHYLHTFPKHSPTLSYKSIPLPGDINKHQWNYRRSSLMSYMLTESLSVAFSAQVHGLFNSGTLYRCKWPFHCVCHPVPSELFNCNYLVFRALEVQAHIMGSDARGEPVEQLSQGRVEGPGNHPTQNVSLTNKCLSKGESEMVTQSNSWG